MLAQELDICRYMESFDFVNVIPYKNTYFKSNVVNNTFDLSELNPLNVRKKIDHLIKCGIPAWKIVLGV